MSAYPSSTLITFCFTRRHLSLFALPSTSHTSAQLSVHCPDPHSWADRFCSHFCSGRRRLSGQIASAPTGRLTPLPASQDKVSSLVSSSIYVRVFPRLFFHLWSLSYFAATHKKAPGVTWSSRRSACHPHPTLPPRRGATGTVSMEVSRGPSRLASGLVAGSLLLASRRKSLLPLNPTRVPILVEASRKHPSDTLRPGRLVQSCKARLSPPAHLEMMFSLQGHQALLLDRPTLAVAVRPSPQSERKGIEWILASRSAQMVFLSRFQHRATLRLPQVTRLRGQAHPRPCRLLDRPALCPGDLVPL